MANQCVICGRYYKERTSRYDCLCEYHEQMQTESDDRKAKIEKLEAEIRRLNGGAESE